MKNEAVVMVEEFAEYFKELLGVPEAKLFFIIAGTSIGGYITVKTLIKRITNKIIKQWTDKIELG